MHGLIDGSFNDPGRGWPNGHDRFLPMQARIGPDQFPGMQRDGKLLFHAACCGGTGQPKVVSGWVDDQSVRLEVREDY